VNAYEISRSADGGVDVIQVSGEFDLAACGAFRAETRDLHPELLVVDLRDATFLDSHALGALIELHDRAQLEDFPMAIFRPTGYAGRIFSITGTEGHLPLYDATVPVLAQMNYG
jgi:anti-anti-sigma factor